MQSLGARVYLNLGSVELARAARAGQAEQDRPRHVEAAASYLGRAAERAPDDPHILRGLAAALAGTEQDGARRALARAEQLTAPGDSRSFFQLGRLYREIMEVDAALAAWEQVDPSLNTLAGAGIDYHLVSWGTSLVLAARWRDAVAVNRAAIRATPTNPAPWAALGVALARELGPPDSLPTLEALAAEYPDGPWAYREVANAHLRAGQWQEEPAWQERFSTASISPAWWEQRMREARARRYHLRWRNAVAGLSSEPSSAPTIGDGLSQDGGARLITNTTDRLRSYVTEVELRRGETPIASARGTAEHVRPGERRAMPLSPTPPNIAGGGIAAVLRTLTQESEEARLATAAARLRPERWWDLGEIGLEVVVRNNDQAAHTFVVQAMLGEDGRFLRLLTGPVTTLAPGERTVVTLLGTRRLPAYNQVLLGVERVLE